MNQENAPVCREVSETVWSSWPDAASVPDAALAHAQTCPACAGELEELRAFCARSPSWSQVLPPSFWSRAAADIRRAVAAPEVRHALLWAPAMAAAALAAVLLVRRPASPALPPDVPAEAVEKHELLENLDILEHWDELAPPPAKEARP